MFRIPSMRRFRSFRIKVLLMLVAVAGIALALITQSYQKQGAAVAVLRRVGGAVRYDHEPYWTYGAVKSTLGAREPNGPRWLRHLVGDTYFAHVEAVGLGIGLDQNRAALETLADLRWLGRLDMPSSNINDADLSYVCCLRHLTMLDLSGSRITDAGAKELDSLDKLVSLDLSFTLITDQGLTSISEMADLMYLHLEHTAITDKGIVSLRALKRLKYLDVKGTAITDRGANMLLERVFNCMKR
jgi:Leucine Rich Repeat (LRR) protein